MRTLILLSVSACFGQRLEIGAKVGVPVTEAFETDAFFQIGFGHGATSATRRYTVGPMVGIRLPRGFSVTLDLLYKRLGFDELTKTSGVLLAHTRTVVNSWEFPVLGQFRVLHAPAVSPYVEAGVSFRSISGIATITEQPLFFPGVPVTRSTGKSSTPLNNRSPHGIAVGLGAEIRVGFMRIAPGFRYTRWGVDRNIDSTLHSNQNQGEVLLGITF